MTTKALERAARALCEHEAEGTCIEGLSDRIFASHIAGDKRIAERYRNKARAVLMAVREPDGDMVRAGHNADPLGDGVEKAGLVYVPVFAAMIDAILNDGEGE